jgi:hypothetical protein
MRPGLPTTTSHAQHIILIIHITVKIPIASPQNNGDDGEYWVELIDNEPFVSLYVGGWTVENLRVVRRSSTLKAKHQTSYLSPTSRAESASPSLLRLSKQDDSPNVFLCMDVVFNCIQ